MSDRAVNIALVVVSALVVLTGLEIALAVGVVETHANQNWDVKYQSQHCENIDGQGVVEFHPDYGWTPKPNSVYYGQATPAQEWERHEINDEGFRDTYDSGDQGVVVLGDSFTYGFLASNDETYPHLLDRWNPDVSVHNFGATGYGPQQYSRIYRDRAGEIDHDLVVVGYYLGNDMTDSIREYPPARPSVDFSDGEIQRIHDPEPGVEFDDPKKYEGVSVERRLTITFALLDRIDEVAAENDAEVLLVTLPRKPEIATSSPLGWVARQREAIDRYAAGRDSVHTLNTNSALSSARRNGTRVYGVYDTHPDDHGYFVIARTVQTWLVENAVGIPVEVAAESRHPREPTPDSGALSRTSSYLSSTTESYPFLSKRTGLLVHKLENALGLETLGVNMCD